MLKVVTPSREEREKHGAQIKEYILEDGACPLAILMSHPNTAGTIIFQIRRCTPDILAIRKAKKKAEIEKQQKLQSVQTNNKNSAVSSAQQNPIQQQQQPLRANLVNGQLTENIEISNGQASEMNGLNGFGCKLPCLVELSPGLFFFNSFFFVHQRPILYF